MITTIPVLRDYQIDLINRARAQMACVKRLLIQAPVGAGKTLIGSEIIRLAIAKGKRVLFLAHRRRLITQKSAKLRDFGIEHGILMNGFSAQPHLPVQVASRDTLLSRSVRNKWTELPPADLVYVDEAHRILGSEYLTLLEMYPNAFHIGQTATAAREDGKGLGDFYQALECCVSISQLIRDGFLCPVTCYAPEAARKKSNRKLAGDPVAQWKRLAEGRPTVLFAGTVAASQAACRAFEDCGIKAEHLDAHTPDEDRDAIIHRVESGETKILCNCSVLIEGVDIPCLSCCILLRMAQSYVLFIQAVGRIMRSFPGKETAILLDHSGAVLEHGFPDEDVRWSLEVSETIEKRNSEDRKEKKRATPIVCPNCAFIYSGAVLCPQCGYKLPRKLQPVALRNQNLTEVDRTLSPTEMHHRKEQYWHDCLRIMAYKGMKAAAAAGMYKQRFKEWPDDSFRNVPRGAQWHQKVADLYPGYLDRGRA